ncbi:hypothetical protein L602_002700000740 [Cupriavidus gilardii J11]|uniref:Uncharacterized protein n=1 Tax=Cupriavidus gilardii J11 TaxID=936133 RepID=A0A562BIP6_9BURK|nr:hydrolase [Cupriavidus gilardii]TWG84982.1 hypothetical protein L602_002700000740 [Cupriavidus gilardii J11]
MLVSAAAHAEDLALASDTSTSSLDTLAESPIDADIPSVLAALTRIADPATPAEVAVPVSTVQGDDADRASPMTTGAATTYTPDAIVPDTGSRWRVHATDVTSASGLANPSIRTFSLALDAVLPRSGITIQPRVQLAWRPRDDGRPNPALAATPPDAMDTGLALRVYGTRPSPAAGVYPFVEADWWQDSRKQTININGTRIDADLLRGLLSFNVGAHGSTRSGVKVWIKIKTGRNAGGIIGARYRW